MQHKIKLFLPSRKFFFCMIQQAFFNTTKKHTLHRRFGTGCQIVYGSLYFQPKVARP